MITMKTVSIMMIWLYSSVRQKLVNVIEPGIKKLLKPIFVLRQTYILVRSAGAIAAFCTHCTS